MKLTFTLLAFIGLLGCASREPEDAAWRKGIDAENWRLCQQVYAQSRVPLTVDGDWNDTKKNLVLNRCRSVLGKYWATY